MKTLLTVTIILFCMTSLAQQKSNTLSAKQKKEGWKLLFDGKSTNGWHSYGKSAAGTAWKVDDGVLYLDTTKKYEKINDKGKVEMKIFDGGTLLTDQEFENFHFSIEWKISLNGNSGVLFLVHEDTTKYKEPYHTGPEMQVLDNDGHADGKLFRHRAGDLYDLINCSRETVKEPGEWNKAEIKMNKGKLDLYLNGVNVVSTRMWDDKWNKMVAKSKFNEWKDFATYKKGHLSLQDHDNGVYFRNIKIKKL
jgi:hypothetical protein